MSKEHDDSVNILEDYTYLIEFESETSMLEIPYDYPDPDYYSDPHTCPRCEGPTEIDGTCDCTNDSDRNYLHVKNKLKYNKVLTVYGMRRAGLPKSD